MYADMFEQFLQNLKSSGIDGASGFLQQHFRSTKDYYKLFEVLKMRGRHRLGLPMMASPEPETETLDPKKQEQLETMLLDACTEVGTLLFKDGRVEEGWAYLQPVGNRELTQKLLKDVPVTEESIDAIVEIAFGHSIAPGYGFKLMLQTYGVCNAITSIDIKMSQRELGARALREVSQTMVDFFYRELLGHVRRDVDQHEQARLPNQPHDQSPTESDLSLGDLLVKHDWIVTQTGHHIDATHLASVVRIARNTDDAQHFQMARDLTEYGLRLPDDFQYPGEPPFENNYVAHQQFFDGLLGINVDQSIDYFTAKTETCDELDAGVVNETLVDYLVRLGRRDDALQWSLENLVGKIEPLGIAPSVFDIANSPSQQNRLAAFFRDQDDLFGFAVCQLKTAATRPNG